MEYAELIKVAVPVLTALNGFMVIQLFHINREIGEIRATLGVRKSVRG